MCEWMYTGDEPSSIFFKDRGTSNLSYSERISVCVWISVINTPNKVYETTTLNEGLQTTVNRNTHRGVRSDKEDRGERMYEDHETDRKRVPYLQNRECLYPVSSCPCQGQRATPEDVSTSDDARP